MRASRLACLASLRTGSVRVAAPPEGASAPSRSAGSSRAGTPVEPLSPLLTSQDVWGIANIQW